MVSVFSLHSIRNARRVAVTDRAELVQCLLFVCLSLLKPVSVVGMIIVSLFTLDSERGPKVMPARKTTKCPYHA